MFDSLLEAAPLSTIRIARLYEYAREVTDWLENTISLGQLIMLLSRPELITPLFGFCITKPGCSRDWLRKPFFKLSSAVRDELHTLYDSHLSALIDPGHLRSSSLGRNDARSHRSARERPARSMIMSNTCPNSTSR